VMEWRRSRNRRRGTIVLIWSRIDLFTCMRRCIYLVYAVVCIYGFADGILASSPKVNLSAPLL
jgi:hypothetical protein